MITLNMLPDVKLEYLKVRRTQAQVISIAVIIAAAVVGITILLAVWVYGGQSLQKKLLGDSRDKLTTNLKNVPNLNKYLTVQNQLAQLSTLHGSKNDFSRLLTFLPTLMPPMRSDVSSRIETKIRTYNPHISDADFGTLSSAVKAYYVSLSDLDLAAVDTDGTGNGTSIAFKGAAWDYTALAAFRDTLANAQLTYKDGNGGTTTEPLFSDVTVASSSLEPLADGGSNPYITYLDGSVVSFIINVTYNPNAFMQSIEGATVTIPNKTTTSSAQSAPSVFSASPTKKEGQQ